MNQIMDYNIKKEQNKECILFYKNGLFYKIYEEDAILISYLLKTKLKHKNHTFYETNIQEKDIDILKNNYSINYFLDDKYFEKNVNQYSLFLEKAKRKLKLDSIYQKLLSMIENGETLEDFFLLGDSYER